MTFWNTLLLASILNNLTLSTVLIFRGRMERFLGFFASSFTLIILLYLLFRLGIFTSFKMLEGCLVQIELLLSPLIYFLVRHFSGHAITRRRLHLHLLPAYLHLLLLPTYTTASPESPLLVSSAMLALLLGLQQAGYLVAMTSLALANPSRISTWIILFFLSYMSCYYLYVWLPPMNWLQSDYYMATLTRVVLVNVLVFYLAFRPKESSQPTPATEKGRPRQPNAASLPQFQSLEHFLKTNELFLQRGLKVSDLAQAFGLSEKQLSQLINEHTGANYNDFINKHRVQKAREMIEAGYLHQNKVLALALEVGFNNKVSFYKAFHKEAGCTPVEYHECRFR